MIWLVKYNLNLATILVIIEVYNNLLSVALFNHITAPIIRLLSPHTFSTT